MDDMGTPGPNHPAHRGLKAPDNVIKLPGMHMRRARLFKNNMLDAVLGPEQVPTAEEHEDAPESHLDNYVNSSIENSGHADELNQMLGRNNNDFHEARIISMGKFKEDKANRELMENNE
jgi:hypothetical protein